MKEVEKIYLGSDHAGYHTKQNLKEYLEKKKFNVVDLSPKYKEGDDYPDIAFRVAKKVSMGENAKGILVCGTGAGMVIVANKVKGIRAVEAYDIYSAKMSRLHNNANILTLGARNLSFEKIKKILDIWLKTEFSGEKRHKRRIQEIKNYEK